MTINIIVKITNNIMVAIEDFAIIIFNLLFAE